MAEKHIDPALLKEALANVEQRIEIALVDLNKGGDMKLMASVLSCSLCGTFSAKNSFQGLKH